MNKHATLDKITALAKRRGFVYPSSEIYGGLANSWDFGHYGVLLKNNIRDAWWKYFILERSDMIGIEASIFLNPKVWEASGHVANFADALIDCKHCKARTRADHLIESILPDLKVEGLSPEELTKIIVENKLKCPTCGNHDFTQVRQFNLLFETKLGIVEGDQSQIYLRGELAQGIFINFKNVLNSIRVRIPFGIAQIGKAFRNEITLGQFVHRTLEFDLMEFEYFIDPTQWEQIYKMWTEKMWQFALLLGLTEGKLRWREHAEHERSHYSKKTADIEYEYPFGFKEMFGLAYRTDFDLKNHMEKSGIDMNYTDKMGNKYVPHVIEPTFGLSRLVSIILTDAYTEEEVSGSVRTVLKLSPRIAPIKVAIFPLQKDEKLASQAHKIYETLKQKFVCEFDDAGNIGKMYRRQDEIGTPFCITVDYETETNGSVTVRDRDTMKQERVAIAKLSDYIGERLA